MTISRRILARHLIAKGQLDLDHVINLLRADKPDEALEVLDALLNKKLDVGVAPKREGFRVRTDWFHALLAEVQHVVLS